MLIVHQLLNKLSFLLYNSHSFLLVGFYLHSFREQTLILRGVIRVRLNEALLSPIDCTMLSVL